jgi:hypothetical protein
MKSIKTISIIRCLQINLQILTVLATLSQKFKFTLLEEKKIEMGPLMTLRPKEDVMVKLEVRGR